MFRFPGHGRSEDARLSCDGVRFRTRFAGAGLLPAGRGKRLGCRAGRGRASALRALARRAPSVAGADSRAASPVRDTGGAASDSRQATEEAR